MKWWCLLRKKTSGIVYIMKIFEKKFLSYFNNRFVQIGIIAFVFAGGIFLGIRIERHTINIDEVNYCGSQLREVSDIKDSLIRPLLLCELSETKQFIRYQPLEDKITSLVNDEIAKKEVIGVSVYFRDLDTGQWTGVNENDTYSPASMLKVPVMIAYFKLAETHPEILYKKVLYDGSFDDNRAETIKPTAMIELGHEYTIEELIHYMIVDSDNNARRLLDLNIDPNALLDVYSDLGISIPAKGSIDFMSAKTYARFFRILYNSTYLSRAMSQKALSLLLEPDFAQGIVAGLPSGVNAAQKFGERTVLNPDGSVQFRELHDCGIVYHPRHPYLACIMTKGTDFTVLEGSIQNISRLLYQEDDQQ